MATTEPDGTEEDTAKKGGSKGPIFVGLVLALALGGGGFYAAFSGMLPLGAPAEAKMQKAEGAPAPMDEVSFVALEPMVVSLGSPGQGRHLRFRAQVEVVPGRSSDVVDVMPRIIDTLNGYLRAVPIEELETPSALIMLRAQMLRRIQLVTAQGSVRDLLIMEFVLS